mmetsp:Transcript_599/g.841  ORF Transcript_599/g.841 Transcript_599/m.841 type:complete len:682 (-) Transcript_599:127-2172(-)
MLRSKQTTTQAPNKISCNKNRTLNMTLLAMIISSGKSSSRGFVSAFTSSVGRRNILPKCISTTATSPFLHCNKEGGNVPSNFRNKHPNFFFSTDSTQISSVVEDDLDQALDDILGNAFEEAGDVKPARIQLEKPVVNDKPTKLDFTDPANLTTTNSYWIEKGMNQNVVDVLSNKGITRFTEVQAEAFEPVLAGRDVIGRSRTGTGKTLAFLIPALERVTAAASNQRGSSNQNVSILVISPTRELATQIGDQAEKLLTYHPKLSCQVMFGGTNMKRDISRMNKQLPTILVATPGRLLDHLENTKLSGGKKFGYDIMRETSTLILDETDRLLDMGFKREIDKILKFLPKKENRQTLLFSATVPEELKKIMAENMRKDYIEVDCIGGDGSSEFTKEEHTNILVEQSHAILPSNDRYVVSVVEIVKNAMSDYDHKLVVFFPTARLVGFFADFFNFGLGIEVVELHSKKSQGYRNKASDKFRNAKTGILFTSDVSARGVDYPNVSGVIQFGLPESRDQYIHRLGRTGRAGKTGQGLIVLSPFEAQFLRELGEIDVKVNEEVTQMLNSPVDEEILNDCTAVFSRVRSGDAQLTQSAQQAYQAFLGYYCGQKKRISMKSNQQIVDVANDLSRLMGLNETPGLTKRAVGKMGLKGVANVRIVSESDIRGGAGGRGGRGGGGGRGGSRRR